MPVGIESEAIFSSNRYSVLLPVSKRIGWATINKQVEQFMQGFTHATEVAIFDSAVGVIPGLVESDGVEGTVYQGHINLMQSRLPSDTIPGFSFPGLACNPGPCAWVF